MLYATIMAGGAGTRFWPASRRGRPKQLLSLVEDSSMLQATVARLNGLCPLDQVLVLTNKQLVEPTQSQLPALPQQSIIGEPCKRDTAPCIGLAAQMISRRDQDAAMLVLPADHVIRQVDQFHQSIKMAEQLIEEDPTRLVTFGIQPSYPAQVFGYVERGEPISDAIYRVEQFREKPDRETAEQFVSSGRFYWNAGIFMWKAEMILRAMRDLEPEMSMHLDRIAAAMDTPQFDAVLSAEFSAINGKSIDYAVMEHYDNVCVVEASFDWDDLGNWTAIPRLSGVDEQGNSIFGKHLGIDTKNSIIRSTDDHLLVTLGMEDCIIVHTADATLIADKTDESAVKQVVNKLEELGWNEYL